MRWIGSWSPRERAVTAIREFVKAAVDPAVFRSGDGLARNFAVMEDRRDGDRAVGTVMSRDGVYSVEVGLLDAGLDGTCECIAQIAMPAGNHMVALALGGLFLRAAARVAAERTLGNARGVLKASVIYLPLLYLALVLDSRFLGL